MNSSNRKEFQQENILKPSKDTFNLGKGLVVKVSKIPTLPKSYEIDDPAERLKRLLSSNRKKKRSKHYNKGGTKENQGMSFLLKRTVHSKMTFKEVGYQSGGHPELERSALTNISVKNYLKENVKSRKKGRTKNSKKKRHYQKKIENRKKTDEKTRKLLDKEITGKRYAAEIRNRKRKTSKDIGSRGVKRQLFNKDDYSVSSYKRDELDVSATRRDISPTQRALTKANHIRKSHLSSKSQIQHRPRMQKSKTQNRLMSAMNKLSARKSRSRSRSNARSRLPSISQCYQTNRTNNRVTKRSRSRAKSNNIVGSDSNSFYSDKKPGFIHKRTRSKVPIGYQRMDNATRRAQVKSMFGRPEGQHFDEERQSFQTTINHEEQGHHSMMNGNHGYNGFLPYQTAQTRPPRLTHIMNPSHIPPHQPHHNQLMAYHQNPPDYISMAPRSYVNPAAMNPYGVLSPMGKNRNHHLVQVPCSPKTYTQMMKEKAQLQAEWEALATQIESMECNLDMMKRNLGPKKEEFDVTIDGTFKQQIKVADKMLFLTKKLYSEELEEGYKSFLNNMIEDFQVSYEGTVAQIKDKTLNLDVIEEMQKCALWIMGELIDKEVYLREIKNAREGLIKELVMKCGWYSRILIKRKSLEQDINERRTRKLDIMRHFEEIDMIFTDHKPNEEILGNIFDKETTEGEINSRVEYIIINERKHVIEGFKSNINQCSKIHQESCDLESRKLSALIKDMVQKLEQEGEPSSLYILASENTSDLISLDIEIMSDLKITELLRFLDGLASLEDDIEDGFEHQNQLEEDERIDWLDYCYQLTLNNDIKGFSTIFEEMMIMKKRYNDLEIFKEMVNIMIEVVRLCIQKCVSIKVMEKVNLELVKADNSIEAYSQKYDLEESKGMIEKIVLMAHKKLDDDDMRESLQALSNSEVELKLYTELKEIWWLFYFYLRNIKQEDNLYVDELNTFIDSLLGAFNVHEGQFWSIDEENKSIGIDDFLRELNSLSKILEKFETSTLNRIHEMNYNIKKGEEAIEERQEEIAMMNLEARELKQKIKALKQEKKELYQRSAKRGAFTDRVSAKKEGTLDGKRGKELVNKGEDIHMFDALNNQTPKKENRNKRDGSISARIVKGIQISGVNKDKAVGIDYEGKSDNEEIAQDYPQINVNEASQQAREVKSDLNSEKNQQPSLIGSGRKLISEDKSFLGVDMYVNEGEIPHSKVIHRIPTPQKSERSHQADQEQAPYHQYRAYSTPNIQHCQTKSIPADQLQEPEMDFSDHEITNMFARFDTKTIKDRFIRKLMTQLKLRGELGNNGYLWLKKAIDGMSIIKSLDYEDLEEFCDNELSVIALSEAINKGEEIDMSELGYERCKLSFNPTIFGFDVTQDHSSPESSIISKRLKFDDISIQKIQDGEEIILAQFTPDCVKIDSDTEKVLAELMGVFENNYLSDETEKSALRDVDLFAIQICDMNENFSKIIFEKLDSLICFMVALSCCNSLN